MAAGGRGITVEIDEAELARLVGGTDGTIVRLMSKIGEAVTKEAKRRAPVSPDGSHGRRSGYLRSKIAHDIPRRDATGWYVDIRSPARTPAKYDARPYGLFVEVGTRPHWIRIRYAKVLANRKAGQIFGTRVWHPGTKPQPYLRPALDYVMAKIRAGRFP